MNKLSEHALQKSIVEWLEYHGWLVFRLNSGAIKTPTGYMKLLPKGTPDLLALKRGYVPLFIEVKLPKGLVSPEQIDMMAKLKVHGAVCMVIRNIDEIEEELSDKD